MSYWGIYLARNGKATDSFLGLDLNLIELTVGFISSKKRIGPHNKDILDFQTGSLLGDGHLELHGNGSRLCLQQEDSHKAYLLWSHKFLAERGYCNPEIPKIVERIGNKGQKRYVLRTKTWTYSSFEFFYSAWYFNRTKILPINFTLTPFALAIWIMDDGGRSGAGLKLATNNFTYIECERLKLALIEKNLKVSIHKTGVKNQYNQYIHKSSKPQLIELILPFIHPSKKYKFAL